MMRLRNIWTFWLFHSLTHRKISKTGEKHGGKRDTALIVYLVAEIRRIEDLNLLRQLVMKC